MPIAAAIVAQEGKKERAVELLALGFDQSKSAMGWMEKLPFFTQFRQDLETDLGEEAYNTAWERGKQLDLETVVQKLLDEFANDA